MKFIIVFVAVFALALAAPADQKEAVSVLRSESNVGVNDFSYSLETSDGTNIKQEGSLKNQGSENEAIAVRGSFSYVADDGVTYTVTYVADENGYQPSGAHLPVAPEA